MKKLAGLHFLGAWLIFLFALVVFSGQAQAILYDDFLNSGINYTILWQDVGTNTGLFSQPGDGFLYFNDTTGGQNDKLRSYNRVNGAFTVVMYFSEFQAENGTTAGAGLGSSVVLRLGDGDLGSNNTVSVLEYKNNGGTGFQAVSVIGGTRVSVDYDTTTHNYGALKIVYNGIAGPGGTVDCYYDSGAGWTSLGTVFPQFTLDPYFSIIGNDTNGSLLSFKVSEVQLTTVPLPPSAWLFGFGLVGLIGLRRCRKS